MKYLDSVKVITVKMEAPSGQLIELLKFHTYPEKQKSRKINDIGITHIAFTVDDLNFEYERLKNEGVQFNAPPQLSPDGYAKTTFCVAPEGTL